MVSIICTIRCCIVPVSGQHVACFKTAYYEGSLRAVCQVQGHWASFEGHAISRGNEENQIEN